MPNTATDSLTIFRIIQRRAPDLNPATRGSVNLDNQVSAKVISTGYFRTRGCPIIRDSPASGTIRRAVSFALIAQTERADLSLPSDEIKRAPEFP